MTAEINEKLARLELRDQSEIGSIILTDAVVRPDGGGKSGKEINVVSNYFKVSFPESMNFWHYHVDIIPLITDHETKEVKPAPQTDRLLPSALLLQVFRHAKDQLNLNEIQRKSLVFDGRHNAYTINKHSWEKSSVQIDLSKPNSTRRRLFRVDLMVANKFTSDALVRFLRSNRQDLMANDQMFGVQLPLVLQAFNVAFKQPAIDRYQSFGASGRKFYDLSNPREISSGAVILRGMFQSVVGTQKGLAINLDPCFSAFISGGKFLDVAAKVLAAGNRGGGGGRGRGGFDRGGGRGRGRGGYGGEQQRNDGAPQTITILQSSHEMQTLRRQLAGVSIRLSYRDGKPEKFKGFSPHSARTTRFEDKDGKSWTVQQYIEQTYKLKLKYPDLPCLQIGQRRDNFVPPELCIIEPGTIVPVSRMKPSQTQDMIRASALRPQDRSVETMKWRKDRNYEADEVAAAWQCKVEPKMIEFKARVLPPPTVTYGPKQTIVPQNGSWNLKSVRFNNPGIPLKNLVIVNFSNRSENDANGFVNELLSSMAALGMNVRECHTHYKKAPLSSSADHIEESLLVAGREAFRAVNKQTPPQLFILLLDDNEGIYGSIKTAAAVSFPVSTPTQCVKASKACNERGQKMYCANVAMKINIKLGGICQVVVNPLDIPRLGKSTMIVGIDVAHAPPGSDRPSIVAAVCTTNGSSSKFFSEAFAQENPKLRLHSQEIVLDAQPMFVKLLQAWRKESGGMPEQILVTRDGLSTGEFKKAADVEYKQLVEACMKVFAKKPKITFCIGTKRHRSRFYATNSQDCDRSGNLPAGTVVDLLHPFAFTFFLQAHGGLQGTCVPCCYTVVKNGIGFTSDELQKLLNSLSYTYQKATKGVSQTPLAKYAHFLCAQITKILYNSESMSDTESSISLDHKRAQATKYSERLQAIMNKIQKPSGSANLATLGETLWFC